MRRGLPERGRLHIDRPLPFLCVYRRPDSGEDPGTRQLVMAEAAYLVVSGRVPARTVGRELLRPMIETLVQEFGAFLLTLLSTHIQKNSPKD